MLLFLYGTLLDPAVLARQTGQKGLGKRLRPALLAGFARVALRGTPYPTLLPKPGAMTDGAVLRAAPAAWQRLAAYEGPSYRLMPVQVMTRRGPAWAKAWMAAPWRAAPGRIWQRRDTTPLPSPELAGLLKSQNWRRQARQGQPSRRP